MLERAGDKISSTLEYQMQTECLDAWQGRVRQVISMDIETNALLHQICDVDGSIPSMSEYVCNLIRSDARLRKISLNHNHIKHAKRMQSRFELVKYTIISRLYDAAEGCNFTYKEFSRLMSDPPISLIRERTIQEYMDKLISLGYIEKVEDDASMAYQPRKNGYQPYSLFKLSDRVVKAQGKLEGLQ